MSTIKDFCEKLGSVSPIPGGGAAAGVCLGMGAACSEKAARFSLSEDHNEYIISFSLIRDKGLQLSDQDQDAFDNWQKARKLPKSTDDEKKIRQEKVNYYAKECIKVPYEICVQSLKLAETLEKFIPNCNKWLISDASIGAMFAKAAFDAGLVNIDINLPYLKDEELKKEIHLFVEQKTHQLNKLTDSIIKHCNDLLKQ